MFLKLRVTDGPRPRLFQGFVSPLVVLLAIALSCAAAPVSRAFAAPANAGYRVLVQLDDWRDDRVRAVTRLASSVHFQFPEIKTIAVTVNGKKAEELSKLAGVRGVYRDRPVTAAAHSGLLSWNTDLIDVEGAHAPPGPGLDGAGVYVAVLDTGLVPHWKEFFDEGQIAGELGVAIHSRTGADRGPAWASGTDSHGTTVASVILGYKVYDDFRVSGVAPGAKLIPVKVLGNDGQGWTSTVIAGVLYVKSLAEAGYRPIVANLSFGSSTPSYVEHLAIQEAVEAGVVVVASAGNGGDQGMTYPAAYPEVISVGAAGWTGEWRGSGDWWMADLPESGVGLYVPPFSARERIGQELDLLAPGTWVAAPASLRGAAHPPKHARGVPGRYYLVGGTSVAAPHVAGAAALLLQANPSLSPADVESLLRRTALPIPPGSASVYDPDLGREATYAWGRDATGAGLLQVDALVEGYVR